MTATAMKTYPKVYWIWNHRRWCLDNIPVGPDEESPNGWRDAYWNREFFLVEKMLGVDPRNCALLRCDLCVLTLTTLHYSPRVELS